MAYATEQDLREAIGYAAAGAQGLLDRASRDIDRALQCAVYAVDTDGNPTDAAVTLAMKTATLEQVSYQLEQGNKSGIRHGLQSGVPTGASAGEVALSRGPSVGGSTTDLPWLADQAAWVLREAGLLGWGPIPV